MLTATIALVVMVAVAITSVYSIRRRLRRESVVGRPPVHVPRARARVRSRDRARTVVRRPPAHEVGLVRALGCDRRPRARLPVRAAALPDVASPPRGRRGPTRRAGHVSVICRGRHLDRLAVSGGQFFEWRFLTKGMWWQAHPFSLSARPRPPFLRLTVKAVGDYSSAVATLRPGTRVAIEGPYGAFTTHARRRAKVALIAGGIGVTAVRSLLEDLPRDCDPVVILRASTPRSWSSASEVAELVRHPQGPGPRARRLSLGGADRPPFRARARPVEPGRLCVGTRGVRQSGSSRAVLRLGVPKDSLHFEVYSL